MSIKVEMSPTQLNTYEVPQIALTNQSPALIAHANALPVRVVVRNVGGVTVLVALISAQLSNVGATSGCFMIPPGFEETFVLAPGQDLYAVATGATSRVSVAVSDAYPLFNDQPVSC